MDKIIVLSSDDDDDDHIVEITSAALEGEKPIQSFDESENDDGGSWSDFMMENDRFSPKPNNISSKNCKKKVNRPVHELSDSGASDCDLPDINLNVDHHGEVWEQSICDDFSKSNNSPLKTAVRKTIPEVKGKNIKGKEQQKAKQTLVQEKVKRREAIKEERERKKKEMAFAKAVKQARAEVKRSMKPGECHKLVTSFIDPSVLRADYSGELLSALAASEIDYKIEDGIVPCSITWERQVHTVNVDEDTMTVQKSSQSQRDENVLVVWMWNKLIEEINENALQTTIKTYLSLYTSCSLTIAIFGLEDYFRLQKNSKRRDVRSEVLGIEPPKRKGKQTSYDSAPQVSRGDVEYALADLQVRFNVCHRIANTKADLANLVCQFTKAIAETPFKREKNDADGLDWYASGDSTDCVTVDKEGNGSLQLWQRQLCQFPLASRETSEAIALAYPSPLSLLKAYDKCSNEEEAQNLLENISVRRGPGPISTARRIGPQLSKKIYTFFTSIDETCLIAPD